jgi:hypothetical protein
MSHNPHAAVVCPNCGHHAEYNYCAKCGQPTHLHKDSFFALIAHFVAHYFHYDSKFWNTLKTLWTKPGALTIAYREKQRMRFIDPISLYIFVSAVFFLLFLTTLTGKMDRRLSKSHVTTTEQPKKVAELNAAEKAEAIDKIKADTILNEPQKAQLTQVVRSPKDTDDFGHRVQTVVKRMREDPVYKQKVVYTAINSIPKIVFFMIPVMALILKLLFIRRREAFFVDHGIFALHYHTFWFTIMLLAVINPFKAIITYLDYALIAASVIYFIVSLKKVYQISTRRAIFYSVVTGSAYSFFLFWVIIGAAALLFYQQGA